MMNIKDIFRKQREESYKQRQVGFQTFGYGNPTDSSLYDNPDALWNQFDEKDYDQEYERKARLRYKKKMELMERTKIMLDELIPRRRVSAFRLYLHMLEQEKNKVYMTFSKGRDLFGIEDVNMESFKTDWNTLIGADSGFIEQNHLQSERRRTRRGRRTQSVITPEEEALMERLEASANLEDSTSSYNFDLLVERMREIQEASERNTNAVEAHRAMLENNMLYWGTYIRNVGDIQQFRVDS